MQSFKELGISIDMYLASEIDEDAIKIAMFHFPNIIQLGDISKIKIKMIYLSEVYNYLCKKYFNGNIQSLQSIIPEWEMLYRINKEENFSAYFGAQKERKNGKKQSNTPISINDRIWFWKNPMGNFEGSYDIIRSGDRREIPNTLNVRKLCEHSFWWNGNGQYKPRIEEESIERTIGKNSNGKIKTIDTRILKDILFIKGIERTSTNKSIGTISGPNKKTELFECNEEVGQRSNGVGKTKNRQRSNDKKCF